MFASGLAYCFHDRIMQRDCSTATVLTLGVGMEPIHALDNDLINDPISYTMLLRESQKQLIIAFSGTLLTIQLFNQVIGNRPINYNIHERNSGARVFRYFYDHYRNGFRDDFLEQIKDASAEYVGYDIIFTGHSLGGALTLHAAADSFLSGYLEDHRIKIYTFGQPRIGNVQWLDLFLPEVDDYYRVVNFTDAVSNLPPCIPNFRGGCVVRGPLIIHPLHASTEVWFDGDGETNVCSETLGEDPACSLSVTSLSIDHHTNYFGRQVGSLREPNNTVSHESLDLIKSSE
jgi:hypothetical protein